MVPTSELLMDNTTPKEVVFGLTQHTIKFDTNISIANKNEKGFKLL